MSERNRTWCRGDLTRNQRTYYLSGHLLLIQHQAKCRDTSNLTIETPLDIDHPDANRNEPSMNWNQAKTSVTSPVERRTMVRIHPGQPSPRQGADPWGSQVILVFNRWSDSPDFATHANALKWSASLSRQTNFGRHESGQVDGYFDNSQSRNLVNSTRLPLTLIRRSYSPNRPVSEILRGSSPRGVPPTEGIMIPLVTDSDTTFRFEPSIDMEQASPRVTSNLQLWFRRGSNPRILCGTGTSPCAA